MEFKKLIETVGHLAWTRKFEPKKEQWAKNQMQKLSKNWTLFDIFYWKERGWIYQSCVIVFPRHDECILVTDEWVDSVGDVRIVTKDRAIHSNGVPKEFFEEDFKEK